MRQNEILEDALFDNLADDAASQDANDFFWLAVFGEQLRARTPRHPLVRQYNERASLLWGKGKTPTWYRITSSIEEIKGELKGALHGSERHDDLIHELNTTLYVATALVRFGARSWRVEDYIERVRFEIRDVECAGRKAFNKTLGLE